ncbi:MAG: methylmalonyl-CoA mutase family protein, partial [Pseudobdellovibrionaceae bacterium]|nr:methylmalonyl-CoA mutase family protein [Pseudobdellovibrionaceae bacterium]
MTLSQATVYKPQHQIRIVTAASLFDGHDAAINIMRRILQASGAEVIHLGHNRSAAEIVECAIQEDAQGIAITSYQGGHLEFFKYIHDLLKERQANIRVFGGGGGTILPTEIAELHAYGITRIYSPDDGRAMGLQGMINHLLQSCDFSTQKPPVEALLPLVTQKDPQSIARVISVAENFADYRETLQKQVQTLRGDRKVPVLGITGTGGAGKSSLVDELVRRYLRAHHDKTVAIVSVDPSKRKTGGALLGDRIRMNAIHHPRVYMRSLATRQSNLALSKYVQDSIEVCKAAGFDLIIVETSGIGQSDTEIVEHSDVSLYVMTSEYGAATQLEKIDMLDFADVIAINKFDKRGSLDALRDVRKQYRRNHNFWTGSDDDLPVLGTIASQFNDPGMNLLYNRMIEILNSKTQSKFQTLVHQELGASQRRYVMPPDRVRYLAELSENHEQYKSFTQQEVSIARQLFQILGTIGSLRKAPLSTARYVSSFEASASDTPVIQELIKHYNALEPRLDHECRQMLVSWHELKEKYAGPVYQYKVRDKIFEQSLITESLSHLKVRKVALPRYEDWGEILGWLLTENVPGEFPYAAGVFPLKREGEDPARMFAGEGGPERTNKRFHYVSHGMPAKRLSTAFDSVTLYGEDPDHRPDIYGKIGNSGVSIATVDDAKKLYSGFNLAQPNTSVSMTINGPAPMLLTFFLNTAIDQQCELYIREQGLTAQVEEKIKAIYRDYDGARPRYDGELPEGNDGLGLLLLGVTG